MKSRDFQARIDAAREDGWRVTEEGTDRVVLKRPSYGSRLGHLLVGVATVWWSFGLGNLAYAVYEYLQHTERKVLYSESSDEDPMVTLRRRYARGEIDEAELERRAEQIARSETETATDSKSRSNEKSDTRLDRLRERLQ